MEFIEIFHVCIANSVSFLAGISRQETPQPKVAAMDESVADTVGAIGSLHKSDSTHLTLTLRMCA